MTYNYFPSVKDADVPKPLIENWEWQQEGNCIDLPNEVMFLEIRKTDTEGRTYTRELSGRERSKAIQLAVSYCTGCPVKIQCQRHALSVPEVFGVWGGTTPEQRSRMIARANRTKLSA
jgi:WhiB family redox-sensing transcriptional regulator